MLLTDVFAGLALQACQHALLLLLSGPLQSGSACATYQAQLILRLRIIITLLSTKLLLAEQCRASRLFHNLDMLTRDDSLCNLH